MKFSGFTLAEALIAVGVIGVIAVLTVPGLVSSYQKDSYLITLKKVYTELTNNIAALQTENYRHTNNIYKSKLASSSGVKSFLTEYYSVSKDCGTGTSGCFATTYYSMNGIAGSLSLSGGYGILTKAGYALYIIPADETSETPAEVYIDTNGPDEPNTGGRDMFKVNIYKDYRIDTVADRNTQRNTAAKLTSCKASTFGADCFGIIYDDNWKMKY